MDDPCCDLPHAGKMGFLIAGAIMFPIAIIHGVMIWFGYGYAN